MSNTLVHVISADDVFGPEKTTINECKQLNQQGWNCIIVNIWSEEDTPIKAKILDAGIEYHCLISTSKLDLSLISRLKALLISTECKLLHSHGYKADLFSYLAARNSNIAMVTSVHGWTSEDFKVRLYEKLQAFIWRFYDRVFAVSDGYRVTALNKNVPESKLRLLYNGIIYSASDKTTDKHQAKQSLGINPETVAVGIVGRLSIEKGHEMFLDVAAKCLKLNKKVSFVIIGDGVELETLQQQVAKEDISDNVVFLGHIDNMDSVYAALDIVAICSYREGLPNALLEAMLNYIPVVSIKVGGVPEVVADNQGGILIEGRNVQAFSDAVLSLANDEDYRNKLGEIGHNRIKNNFTFERRMDSVIEHYKELIALKNIHS